MRALALDLALVTGYCLGPLSERPEPKILSLSVEGQGVEAAAERLSLWLRSCFADPETRPDVVVVERKLPASAHRGGNQTEAANMLLGVVVAMTACYKIERLSVANGTWLKSFTGRGKHGSRKENKQASLRAAKFHGFVGQYETSNDKADAAGLFFWLAGEKMVRQKRLDAAREFIPF